MDREYSGDCVQVELQVRDVLEKECLSVIQQIKAAL